MFNIIKGEIVEIALSAIIVTDEDILRRSVINYMTTHLMLMLFILMILDRSILMNNHKTLCYLLG